MPKFYYARILETELWKTATVPTNLCLVISVITILNYMGVQILVNMYCLGHL
jgi:hypothetical protein